MPRRPPSPFWLTFSVATGVGDSAPFAATSRTAPVRSVTSARPSGTNAMSHGTTSPVVMTLTVGGPLVRARAAPVAGHTRAAAASVTPRSPAVQLRTAASLNRERPGTAPVSAPGKSI